MFKAQRLGALIFFRAIAGERDRKIGKFAQHATAAATAFDHFHFAATHQRNTMIFFMRRGRRGHVGLVAFRIADIDLRNPIAFGHRGRSITPTLYFFVAERAISATIASAAAFGSVAAMIGRPTTR